MMKPFDHGLKYVGALIPILIVFFANTSDAGNASEVFRRNKDRILSSAVTVRGNYTFSKGVATPVSASSSSAIFAKRKAKHRAFVNLSTYILTNTPPSRINTDLPDTISDKLIQKLYLEHTRAVQGELVRIKGTQKVYSNFDGTRAIVVIAIENKTVEHMQSAESRTFQEVSNPRDCADISGFDPFLCYEICPQKDTAAVRQAIFNYLKDNYGSNAAGTVKLDPIEKFFEAWEPKYEYVDNLDLTDLKSLSLEEALVFLNEMPYHPLVCFLIAEKFRQEGFVKTADLFYRSGTKLFLSERYSRINLDRLNDQSNSGLRDDFMHMSTTRATIFDAYQKSNIQFPYRADFIIKSLGSVPCSEEKSQSELYYEGNTHFKAKDFEKALQRYLSAMQKSVTADLLNMIGMTLIELDNSALAIPFLKQAVYLNQNHKFAIINLTQALYDSGFRDLALQSYDLATKNPDLDEWGAYKLEKMKAKLSK